MKDSDPRWPAHNVGHSPRTPPQADADEPCPQCPIRRPLTRAPSRPGGGAGDGPVRGVPVPERPGLAPAIDQELLEGLTLLRWRSGSSISCVAVSGRWWATCARNATRAGKGQDGSSIPALTWAGTGGPWWTLVATCERQTAWRRPGRRRRPSAWPLRPNNRQQGHPGSIAQVWELP